jgi:hypothetical protein
VQCGSECHQLRAKRSAIGAEDIAPSPILRVIVGSAEARRRCGIGQTSIEIASKPLLGKLVEVMRAIVEGCRPAIRSRRLKQTDQQG